MTLTTETTNHYDAEGRLARVTAVQTEGDQMQGYLARVKEAAVAAERERCAKKISDAADVFRAGHSITWRYALALAEEIRSGK